MFRRSAVIGSLIISFVVAACNSDAAPTPTPIQINGITPLERALSIADVVSQTNPDIYVVSEAIITGNGFGAAVFNSEDQSVVGSGMFGEGQPVLWYTIVVTKPSISFTASDQIEIENGAVQLLSLSAEYLLSGKQSFALIAIAVVYQDTTSVVFVDSYKNLSDEAAKTSPDYLSLFKGSLHEKVSYTVFLDNDPLFAGSQPAPPVATPTP